MPSRVTRHTVISFVQFLRAEVRDREPLPVGREHRLRRQGRELAVRALQHRVTQLVARR